MSRIPPAPWRTARPPAVVAPTAVYATSTAGAAPARVVVAGSGLADDAWRDWLVVSWPYLRSGDRLPVPRELAHPAQVGFARPRMAERRGQVADWVISLTDGSRLHLHEYANGTIVAHRDSVDPSRGALAAAWHFATEARMGRVLVGAIAVVGAIAAR